MSFQAVLQNRTPFSADKFVMPDQDGQEAVLVVVSATFRANATGALTLADEQRKIRIADEYNGPPDRASVRYEADLALEKPSLDVLVNGHAYAPRGRPASVVSASLTVGDVQKEVRVSGDRFWLAGQSPSSPRPFVMMPLVYERAFGGIDGESQDIKQRSGDRRNFSGVGFDGIRSYDRAIQTEVPNIEYPHVPIRKPSDKPDPAGLGVIARSWSPRLAFAGTFDEKWLAERWPLLPTDFDSRHYQSAPVDQQSRQITGGEIASLVNLTEDGFWRFRVPAVHVRVHLLYDSRRQTLPLSVDTLLIEPDQRTVIMTGRVCARTRRTSGLLREIVVGEASSAWLRARQLRKRYFGRDGLSSGHTYYRL